MSEENNWNYGNDEPNVNQGNPVSLEKSTTDGTAGVNLEKTVTGNEERVNPEKTMTDNPYYTNTSYGNGNTNYNYGQSNDSAGYNYGQSNGSTDYNYGQPNGNNQSESEGFGIASLIYLESSPFCCSAPVSAGSPVSLQSFSVFYSW